MEFVQSVVMTNEIVQQLTTPLLNRFLTLARRQDNVWAVGVAGRLRDLVGETVPHTWAISCDPRCSARATRWSRRRSRR